MEQQGNNRVAEFAYNQIAEKASGNKEFRSLSRSFPSMLHKNGLGAAIAFLYSKDNGKANTTTPQGLLYGMIEKWLEESAGITPPLMEEIVKMDSASYRMCFDQIMVLCLWIKRFAEGMISNEE